jgi:hypothetical protein
MTAETQQRFLEDFEYIVNHTGSDFKEWVYSVVAQLRDIEACDLRQERLPEGGRCLTASLMTREDTFHEQKFIKRDNSEQWIHIVPSSKAEK